LVPIVEARSARAAGNNEQREAKANSALSAQARELGERIEEFCRQTVVTDLRSLPGG
jgi:hypothetical protein